MSCSGCNNSMQSSDGGSSPTPSHSSSDSGGDSSERTVSDIRCGHVGVESLVQLPPVEEVATYWPPEAATRPKIPRTMDPSGEIPSNVIPTTFSKTLSNTDVNSNSGFLVPRECAATVFPPLDYSQDRCALPISLWDEVKRKWWQLEYIYRRHRKSHHLQKGWIAFLKDNLLEQGDIITFSKTSSGKLCVKTSNQSKGKLIMSSPENHGPAVGLIVPTTAPSMRMSITGSLGESSQQNHGQAMGLTALTAASTTRMSMTGCSGESAQQNHGPADGLIAPTAESSRRSSIMGTSGKSAQENHEPAAGLFAPTAASSRRKSSNITWTRRGRVLRAIQEHRPFEKDLRVTCSNSEGKSYQRHDLQGSRLDGDRIRENAGSFSQSYSNGKSHQNDLQGDGLDDKIRGNPGSSSQSSYWDRENYYRHDSQGDRLDAGRIRENPGSSSQSSYQIITFRESDTIEHILSVNQSQFSSSDELYETLAMILGQESGTIERAVDRHHFSYDDHFESLARMFGSEVFSMIRLLVDRNTEDGLRAGGSEPFARFPASARQIDILHSTNSKPRVKEKINVLSLFGG